MVAGGQVLHVCELSGNEVCSIYQEKQEAIKIGGSLCVYMMEEEVRTIYEVTPADSAAELNRPRISTSRFGIAVANHKTHLQPYSMHIKTCISNFSIIIS